MPKATNVVRKKLPKLVFLVVYIFRRFFLKSSFSINNPILKMNDYDFSIQDLVQGYPLQS